MSFVNLQVLNKDKKDAFLVLLINSPNRTIRKKASKMAPMEASKPPPEATPPIEMKKLESVISEHVAEKEELIGAIAGLEITEFEERVREKAREAAKMETEDLFSLFLASSDDMQLDRDTATGGIETVSREGTDIYPKAQEQKKADEADNELTSGQCGISASPETVCQLGPVLTSHRPLHSKDPNQVNKGS